MLVVVGILTRPVSHIRQAGSHVVIDDLWVLSRSVHVDPALYPFVRAFSMDQRTTSLARIPFTNIVLGPTLPSQCVRTRLHPLEVRFLSQRKESVPPEISVDDFTVERLDTPCGRVRHSSSSNELHSLASTSTR